MHKTVIICDLDNTIIFSHRHDIGDKIPVEKLNGKNQSYMTIAGYVSLQMKKRDEFIPLTTRRFDQYKRLSFFKDGRIPHYAMIDNGGVLLIDGNEDISWKTESLDLISKDNKSIRRIQKKYSAITLTMVQDGMVLYIKSDSLANEIEYDALSYGLLYFRHRNKNYVCSSALEKGKAIGRFKKRFHPNHIVVAGDSEIDLSMIQEADEAYMSTALIGQVPADAKISFINPLMIAETVFRR